MYTLCGRFTDPAAAAPGCILDANMQKLKLPLTIINKQVGLVLISILSLESKLLSSHVPYAYTCRLIPKILKMYIIDLNRILHTMHHVC